MKVLSKRWLLGAVALAIVAAMASQALGAPTGDSAHGLGATTGAKVATAQTSLGRILVDSKGLTLYLWLRDTRGRSVCSDACAGYWPPLLTRGKPAAVHGAKASLVGVTRRSDGTTQVTYDGHPLYRYAGDSRPGETNGQGSQSFGAGWYVLSQAGRTIVAGA